MYINQVVPNPVIVEQIPFAKQPRVIASSRPNAATSYLSHTAQRGQLKGSYQLNIKCGLEVVSIIKRKLGGV